MAKSLQLKSLYVLIVMYQVVYVHTLSLSLGVEPVDKDVMTRPPRRAKDPMITLTLIAQVVGAAGMIVMGTLYVFRREVNTPLCVSHDCHMTFHRWRIRLSPLETPQ